MERIYLTGGTGKLGRSIIKAFDFNTDITCLTRSKELYLTHHYGKLKFVYGDITERCSLAIPTGSTVIHAAGLVSFNEFHRKNVFKANVDGTRNVIAAAESARCRRIIYISSAICCGTTPLNDCRVLDERDTSTDKNCYVESKLAAEDLIKRCDIPIKIIVRPASCNLHDIVKEVRESRKYPSFPGIVSISDIETVGEEISDLTICSQSKTMIPSCDTISHYDLVMALSKDTEIVLFPEHAKYLKFLLMLSTDKIKTPYVFGNLFRNKIYSYNNITFPDKSYIIRRAIQRYESSLKA